MLCASVPDLRTSCRQIVEEGSKRAINMAVKAVVAALKFNRPLSIPNVKLLKQRDCVNLHRFVALELRLHRRLLPFSTETTQNRWDEYAPWDWLMLGEVVQHAEVGCLTMPDILFCAALMHRCTACMLVSHPCFAGCHTACPWMQPCLNNTGAALHVRCHQAGHMFGLPCRHAGQALLFCCLPPCAAMLEQSWRCSAASCPRCLAADVLLNMVDGRCMETGSIPGSPYLRPAPRRGP